MNRRNFILGLGTAATLSGAASVTGAALSNTVESTADFQVVATNDLTVRRNNELESENIGLSNASNYSDTPVDQFDPKNATPYSNLTVNGSTDENLGMALATDNVNGTDYNNNDSFGGTEPYNGTGHSNPSSTDPIAPLQIENNGGTAKDVEVAYGLGNDVDTGAVSNTDGNIDPVDVAQLFTFEIGGTQISPPADGGTNTTTAGSSPTYLESTDNSSNVVSISAGETKEVDFIINYSDRLEQLISDNASGGSYGISSDSEADVSLLNTVRFGSADS